ncbi:hypothetical protein DVH24_039495 [Malus domestica]|uniref:Uncharacterized protein n=1 Tax=Malus domestica TaxID=3750 RepID=A0A498HWG4_MALDO|nr:hypothetical protein DVH24_039495 [Malus domestica]
MESFMDTPKGSVMSSNQIPDWLCLRSRGVLINCEGFTQIHREQMALNLPKEGRLSLRSLRNDDLNLVDFLIPEKNRVEEFPSQMSPFKLADSGGKRSFD